MTDFVLTVIVVTAGAIFAYRRMKSALISYQKNEYKLTKDAWEELLSATCNYRNEAPYKRGKMLKVRDKAWRNLYKLDRPHARLTRDGRRFTDDSDEIHYRIWRPAQ